MLRRFPFRSRQNGHMVIDGMCRCGVKERDHPIGGDCPRFRWVGWAYEAARSGNNEGPRERSRGPGWGAADD